MKISTLSFAAFFAALLDQMLFDMLYLPIILTMYLIISGLIIIGRVFISLFGDSRAHRSDHFGDNGSRKEWRSMPYKGIAPIITENDTNQPQNLKRNDK